MILLEVQLLEEVSITPWVVIVYHSNDSTAKITIIAIFVDYCC